MIFNDYIRDLRLTYSSSTAVLVGPPSGAGGYAMDSTNTVLITLAAQATVTITTIGAISGNDAFTGPGTVSVTSALFAVTGVSTTFLTSFGPNGTPRAGTGTATNSTTTITGTGTKFLSQVAVGDLIGNTASGYAQVTAIASDTSLTTVSAVTLSSAAFKIIENPTIKIDTNTVVQVSAIASDTALTISSGASATKAGVTYSIGQPSAASTMPTTNIGYMMFWIGVGSSGTGCYASTQRTTPFGVTNYNVNFRRIGSLMTTAQAIIQFDQYGLGFERWYMIEVAAGSPNRVLTSGTATAWTGVVCAATAPPTASVLNLAVTSETNAGNPVYVRKRSSGDANLTRPMKIICNSSLHTTGMIVCACDGVQAIDYVCAFATTPCTINVAGYMESL